MPVLPPNRGGDQPKPPWFRDTATPVTQQVNQIEVPWRKVQLRKTSVSSDPPPKVEEVQSAPPPEEPQKPFTSKIQVNLKTNKPQGESSKASIEPGPPTQKGPVKKDTREAKSISIPIKIETSKPIEPTPPPSNKAQKFNSTTAKSNAVQNQQTPPTKINHQQAEEKSVPMRRRPTNNNNTNTTATESINNTNKMPNETRAERRLREDQQNRAPPPTKAAENGMDAKIPKSNPPPMAPAPPAPPPPPPPPAGRPPPPPPPPNLLTLTPQQKNKVEQLKKVPRKRPDWSVMMKEIETGKKLKKVECNDRSKPIIPRMKSLGKFVFDSEAKPASKTDALHNRLLTEIQHGVPLKKVETNDRSKPFIAGLRKFRRQLTVEEQDKVLDIVPEEPVYEIEDIDQLRDDLQSAKQMMDMEIQAKIQLGKENRDLKCQIIALEAEIERMKVTPESNDSSANLVDRRDSHRSIRKSRSGLYKCPSGIRKSKSNFAKAAPKEDEELVVELEEEINALKNQMQEAAKQSEDWEAKFKEASQKLLFAQGTLEDSEQKRLVLEKKLEKVQRLKGVSTAKFEDKPTQTEEQILTRRQLSLQKMGNSFSNAPGTTPYMYQNQHPSLDRAESHDAATGSDDEESSEMEVDEATVQAKKQEREIKLWENKLKSIKEKQNSSKADRRNLKEEQKRLEQNLKEEKAKLKKLQKELDKMAKVLDSGKTATDLAMNEEEEEEEEEESEEEEEESESESESEESEEEESSSEEDDPEEDHETRLGVFLKRVKRRENVLNALRKGNYLLRANIDTLKDSHEEIRIKYQDLELELNNILEV